MILDIQQMQARVRRIARIGNVAFSGHCQNDSMVKRNVDVFDILKVLRNGALSHEPDPDNEMKFRVVGEDIQNKELTVIIDLYDEYSLSVITVW